MMVSFSQLFKRRGQQGGGREKRRQEARVKGAGGWRVSNQRILINPPPIPSNTNSQKSLTLSDMIKAYSVQRELLLPEKLFIQPYLLLSFQRSLLLLSSSNFLYIKYATMMSSTDPKIHTKKWRSKKNIYFLCLSAQKPT